LDMFCGAFIVSAQQMSVDIHCHCCVSVPSRFDTVFTGVPAPNNSEACVCRKS
jgi:hypothetical protein